MTRTRLHDKYRKDSSAGNQRNLCVKLVRKSKKNFYNNPNMKRVTDNFWQTVKPNFTEKTLEDERITIADREKIITEKKKELKKFKDHFEKIVETLKIDDPILSYLSNDAVLNATKNFSTMLVFLKSRKRETLLISFPLN